MISDDIVRTVDITNETTELQVKFLWGNIKHRAFHFNEASGRYKEFDWEVYDPESWRIQDTKNKQGSLNAGIENLAEINDKYYRIMEDANTTYDALLKEGIAREQARMVMPVSHYTEFFFTADLRNLFNFLELRTHSHAQYEIRVYADAILEILEGINELKSSIEVFKETRDINNTLIDLLNKNKNDLESLNKSLLLMKGDK